MRTPQVNLRDLHVVVTGASRGVGAALAREFAAHSARVTLLARSQVAIDDLIDVMGRATIEAVLLMSAAQLAGPKQQGKKTDRDIAYHGSQAGRVALVVGHKGDDRLLVILRPEVRIDLGLVLAEQGRRQVSSAVRKHRRHQQQGQSCAHNNSAGHAVMFPSLDLQAAPLGAAMVGGKRAILKARTG